VLVEVRLERELALAARTLVVLGGGMSLDVCTQVRPVGKRLAAVRTSEGLLSSVRSLVTA